MPTRSGGFLRDNAFLVAAVSLPVVVIGFFLLATTVPRWFVAPPAYDLVLRAGEPYGQAAPGVAIEFAVRDERIEATFRAIDATRYSQRTALLVVDHATMNTREIVIEPPPDAREADLPRTMVVEALAGRRVLAQAAAPDGYTFDYGTGRGPGLVGELFGMRGSGPRARLVKDGRVVAIDLPSSYRFDVRLVGWLAEEGQR